MGMKKSRTHDSWLVGQVAVKYVIEKKKKKLVVSNDEANSNPRLNIEVIHCAIIS